MHEYSCLCRSENRTNIGDFPPTVYATKVTLQRENNMVGW